MLSCSNSYLLLYWSALKKIYLYQLNTWILCCKSIVFHGTQYISFYSGKRVPFPTRYSIAWYSFRLYWFEEKAKMPRRGHHSISSDESQSNRDRSNSPSCKSSGYKRKKNHSSNSEKNVSRSRSCSRSRHRNTSNHTKKQRTKSRQK